jgi:fused signal recognition particle receptor
MIIVYILIGLAVLAGVYFGLIRKKPEGLPAAEDDRTPAPKLAAKEAPKEAPKVEAPKAVKKEETAPSVKPPPKSERPKAEEKPVVERPKSDAPKAQVETSPAPPISKGPPSKKEVQAIQKGLSKTRGGFMARLKALFTGKKEIDPAILEQMEEVMISSDVGVKTTQAILGRLRDRLQKNELADEDAVWNALREEAKSILGIGGGGIRVGNKPTVVLMVGVNGVGKTTTIGKLATRATANKQTVLLAAGDTFRAAAVAQLEVWGKRVEATVVKGKEGADPGAVAFEATNKAKDLGVQLLFVDTAGRLHTKAPLMDEIKKVKRTIGNAMNGAPHETLLVLDATTGQNALSQALVFKEAIDLTGIVLTKLDGTAKGGVVLGICDELKVPVRYIGLGERAEDLREFNADEFVEALFGQDAGEAAAA